MCKHAYPIRCSMILDGLLMPYCDGNHLIHTFATVNLSVRKGLHGF